MCHYFCIVMLNTEILSSNFILLLYFTFLVKISEYKLQNKSPFYNIVVPQDSDVSY